LNLLEAYYGSLHPDDIELWRKKARLDILAWVVVTPTNNPFDKYHAWVSPVTGAQVERCPWLRKLPNKNEYICLIQEVKPKHCREYPTSRKHAEDTGCKGFE
jgi:Fe-S-cluster containining protein